MSDAKDEKLVPEAETDPSPSPETEPEATAEDAPAPEPQEEETPSADAGEESDAEAADETGTDPEPAVEAAADPAPEPEEEPAAEAGEETVSGDEPVADAGDEPTPEELAEEENIMVDALTGEVIEGAADDDELAVPEGISPELIHDPYGEEELDISRGAFEALLEERHADFQDIREGEIVEARVLRVTDGAVILEFGFKSEGSVAKDEFKETPEVGEEVEVLLESLEDEDGIVVLSKKKADFLRVWEKIREAHDADRPVKGTLVRKIKGGVTVDLMGVDAFLPGSQIALRRVPNIDDLIGETYNFKIIKLNKRRRNIVVSRRVILETEREKKRKTLVKELMVGQVREGVVKNVTDFGAFIDLGGLDGLLHITDMSWGRVANPNEVVEIGQDLDVKVLDIDWDRERISLGLKQLLPYPWTDIDKKYPVGARVKGKVVSITNYGAFVELQKGVEGLVHISEMSWTRNVRHPSKLVSIGDEIEAVVLKVDPGEEKISLGMKQIEEDPWLALPVKYPTGTVLSGVVRNLTSFGAFVEIEPGIDGLVHVSDMSWTKRVEHPSELVQKGDELEVMVLDVDAENKRISLGIKQTQDDPWPAISQRFTPGVEVDGTVVRVQDKGVVVDLGDDIEGFVPASHSGVEDPNRLDDFYGPGQPIALRIIESDAANRRIVLEATEEPALRPKEEVEEEPESVEAVDAEVDQDGGESGDTEDADAAEESEEADEEDESGEPEDVEEDEAAGEEEESGEPEDVEEDEAAEEEESGEPEAVEEDEAAEEVEESGEPEDVEEDEEDEGPEEAEDADEDEEKQD